MADNSWKPTVLSIGPGGEKGFMVLGALHQLEINGMLSKVNNYIGCSVGSAISLLLVCGFKPSSIIAKTENVKIFQQFDISNISNIENKGGLLSTIGIRDFLSKEIEPIFGRIPTFRQLLDKTGKSLTVVAHNLNKIEPEYFSPKNSPDMLVIDAIALSVTIPGIFEIIKYNGCTYIDGAFSDPNPVNYYDDGKTSILAIYLTTKYTEKSTNTPTNSEYFIRALYSTMTVLRNKKNKEISPMCKLLSLHFR